MFVDLCEPWPLAATGCPAPSGSPEVVAQAQWAASEVLWSKSGYQYGTCQTTVRPCSDRCADGGRGGPWWDGVSWPSSVFGWWRTGCGDCRAGCCGCTAASTVVLPQVASAVTEVIVDGAVVPPDAYVLYNGRLLVRTDGEAWPLCQDWTVPVSGVGAWSVTMSVGWPVPVLGTMAVSALAKVYADWCTTGVCRLPAYTTGVTRQGVAQQFPSVKELREMNLTGVTLVDQFLDSVNPDGIKGSGAWVWDPDECLGQISG